MYSHPSVPSTSPTTSVAGSDHVLQLVDPFVKYSLSPFSKAYSSTSPQNRCTPLPPDPLTTCPSRVLLYIDGEDHGLQSVHSLGKGVDVASFYASHAGMFRGPFTLIPHTSLKPACNRQPHSWSMTRLVLKLVFRSDRETVPRTAT